MNAITLTQRGQRLPADVQTPISLFLGLVGEKPGILLESAEVDGRLGRFSIIAWDFRLRVDVKGGRLRVHAKDKRLASLEELSGTPFIDGLRKLTRRLTVLPPVEFADLPPISRGLCGYFGYGMAGIFEPKLAPQLPPDKAESCLVLPGKVVVFDHLRHCCSYLTLDDGGRSKLDIDHSSIYHAMERPVLGAVTTRPGQDGYMAAVSTAKDMIRAGECIQVVLSTRFSAPFSGNPFVVYRRLRQVNPSPYMFFMRLPRVTLLGSSPELLVRCQDGQLTTCPIAGTRPRGADAAEDARLAAELLADPKERAEHVMLVDLGRNDLGRIAAPGTVKVEKFMDVERFSHVMHIVSYVTAKLKDGLDALDVLASTFPAGTVSGAPKVRAMQMIADLEKQPRGPYAGSIGWIGLDPGRVDMDTGITIRSLWIRDGMLSWQAGAGIVYDSDPAKEWKECQNKARVLAEVLASKEGGDVFTY
ncbi:anthranilate synthase, aminase component [hydrocarbon metagenome]|uniref:Anthranilate synthase, aminase component n=1 Tax=hydrocarbon metagenome TaxID=938273 RepID=A0A0W8G9M5_9ZZZZ